MVKKSIIEDAIDNAATIHPSISFDREEFAAGFAWQRHLHHGTGEYRKPACNRVDGFDLTSDLRKQDPGPGRYTDTVATKRGIVYVGRAGAANYAGHVAAGLANAGHIV